MGGDPAPCAGESPLSQGGCFFRGRCAHTGAGTDCCGRHSYKPCGCRGKFSGLSRGVSPYGHCARSIPLSRRRDDLRCALYGRARGDAFGGNTRQPLRRVAPCEHRGRGAGRSYGGGVHLLGRFSRWGYTDTGCTAYGAARDAGQVTRDGCGGIWRGGRRGIRTGMVNL